MKQLQVSPPNGAALPLVRPAPSHSVSVRSVEGAGGAEDSATGLNPSTLAPVPLNRYEGRGETQEPWKDRVRSLGHSAYYNLFSACLDGTRWSGGRYHVAPKYHMALGDTQRQVRGAWLHIQALRAAGVKDAELEQFAALVEAAMEKAA